MAKNKSRREELLEEVRKQVEQRASDSTGDLKSVQEILAHLSWLAWHCGRFAAVPSFLEAARSDIVGILYAGAVGMERSAYLHARSLLENLARHCYYDSRPALFAARHLEAEEGVQDKWAELLQEIQHLPVFWPTRNTLESSATASPHDESAVFGRSSLFMELRAVYAQSSRFIHGSTIRYRSAYEGIGSITIDETRTRELGAFLQRTGEVGLLLLAMAHLGPYLLISQPIRRYMLLKMHRAARARFLRCMEKVSLPWAIHQRSAALRVLRERKHTPAPSRDGLLLDEDGRVLVVIPSVMPPLGAWLNSPSMSPTQEASTGTPSSGR
jgi:hypothetical protein